MADKASNVVLNFKMDGQVEYAKTIRDINAIMNAAAAEYKTHVAAMDKDASATQKLAAEKKKLEIQLEAGRKRTEQLRTEYQAMAKDTNATTGQLANKYKQLQNSERAELSLERALEQVNEGLSEQAEESRKAEEALNKLETEAQALETQTEKLNAEYGLQVAQLGANAKEADKLKLKIENLNETHDLAKDKVKNYEEQLEQAKKQYGENSTEVDKYGIQLIEARKAEQELANEIVNTNKELKKQEDVLAKTSKKLEETGKKMKDVGKDMTKKVTAPIAAVGAVSVKSASDFESAFAGVRKTVDATEEEFAGLEQGIRDMTKEIPASASEIAGVAESAGQLGIANEHILSFTRTMIDLGEATNMTSEQAATDFARFANIVGMSQGNFDKLGSTVVDLGNNLATTETEIVSMGMRLAGAGKQIGLTEAQTMSFAGALSSVGIEAEAGGSAFSKVMINMQLAVERGGEELENFAQVANMSGDDFKKAFEEDAAGAISSFIEGLSTVEDRGMTAIGVLDEMGIKEVRMRDALLRAAGASNVFADSLEIGSKAWNENVALSKEAEERYKTFESQLAIFKNQIVDVAIDIGNLLIPVILDVIDVIKPWIARFKEMDESTQKMILVIAGIAAAIGPIILILGTFIEKIGFIGGLISKVVGHFGGFAKIIGIVKGALAALMGPIGIVIGIIVALVTVGVLLYKNWDTIKEKAIEIWGAITDWFSEVWTNISEGISNAWNSIKEFFIGMWESIKEVFSGAISSILGFIEKHWNNIKERTSTIFNSVKETISKIWNNIRLFFTDILLGIWNNIKQKFDDIKTAIRDKMNDAKDKIVDIWDSVMNFFKGIDLKKIGKDIIDGLIGGIKSKVEAVKKAVKDVTGAITGKIKSILNIQSPSRVMMSIGRSITEGLGIGIEDMQKYAIDKTANVTRAITSAMKDGIELPDIEIGSVMRQPSSFGTPAISGVSTLDNIGLNIRDSLKGLSGDIDVHVYLDTDEVNTKLAPGMGRKLHVNNKIKARSQGVVKK